MSKQSFVILSTTKGQIYLTHTATLTYIIMIKCYHFLKKISHSRKIEMFSIFVVGQLDCREPEIIFSHESLTMYVNVIFLVLWLPLSLERSLHSTFSTLQKTVIKVAFNIIQ
jgi:hypothetical protein